LKITLTFSPVVIEAGTVAVNPGVFSLTSRLTYS